MKIVENLGILMTSMILFMGCNINYIEIDMSKLTLPEVSTTNISALDYANKTVILHGMIVRAGHPPTIEKGIEIGADEYFTTRITLPSKDEGDEFTVEYSDWQFEPPFYLRAYAKSDMAISYGKTMIIETEYVEYPMLGLSIQSQNNMSTQWEVAEMICNSSIAGGYSDWRLPTRTELYAIYTQRDKIFNLMNQPYWTNDRADTYRYYALDFSSGDLKTLSGESIARCIRDLTE